MRFLVRVKILKILNKTSLKSRTPKSAKNENKQFAETVTSKPDSKVAIVD